MTRFQQDRRGFTLVELLVVISIIAILIAMLLPALGRARDKVIELQCLTNQRAVSLMSAYYTTDSEGFGPPHQDYREYTFWAGGDAVVDLDGNSFPAMKGLDPYFGYNDDTEDERKVYWKTTGCPKFKQGVNVGSAFGGNHYILGLINGGNPTVRDFWIRLDDPRINTAHTVIYTEAVLAQMRDFQYLLKYRKSPYNYYPRHESGGGFNVIYVDGHGEFTKYDINTNSFEDDLLTFRVPGLTR